MTTQTLARVPRLPRMLSATRPTRSSTLYVILRYTHGGTELTVDQDLDTCLRSRYEMDAGLKNIPRLLVILHCGKQSVIDGRYDIP